MGIEAKVVADHGNFAGLGGAWNDLVDRATLTNIFHRHEWYRCWLDNMAPDAQLRVVLLQRDGRLVAAAPLVLTGRRRKGLTIPTLGFMQSGITPRSGLLVEHDDLCEPLLGAIDAVPGWSVAEFRALELDHPTTRRLVGLLRRRGPVAVEAGMTSPYEELPDSWDAYYQSRTNKIRQRFRGAVNRVHKHETVEVLRLTTYAELEPHFDSLLAISAASWKGEVGTDMATVGQAAAFYQAYSRLTDGQDAWIAYLLRLDGKPVAFMYLLRDGGHWVALRSDYGEAFSYDMPGVYLHKEVITDLAALPAPRIYDLVGFATPFKSSLAHSGRRLCDLTVGAGNLQGRILMVAKGMLARRAPQRYLDPVQVIAGTVPLPSGAADDDSVAEG